MAEARARLFHAPLFALELRRAGGGGLVLFALVVTAALAFALAGGGPPTVLTGSGAGGEPVVRGIAREGVWSGALLFLAPACLFHSAGTIGRWRRGDADWLGSRPTTRAGALASTWCGGAVAYTLLVLAVAACVEVASPQGADAGRFAAGASIERIIRLDPDEVFDHELPDPHLPPGSRLRVRVRPTAGEAPTTDCLFTASRGAGGTLTSARERIASRSWVELDLPPGDGVVAIRVTNQGPGALAILTPGTFELFTPGGSERRASLALATRAALGLAGFSALALGLGAWLSAVTAGAATLVAWLVLVIALGSPGWIPGVDLPRALALVGHGRLPAELAASTLLGLASCLSVGAALAVTGLRSWRFSP